MRAPQSGYSRVVASDGAVLTTRQAQDHSGWGPTGFARRESGRVFSPSMAAEPEVTALLDAASELLEALRLDTPHRQLAAVRHSARTKHGRCQTNRRFERP
jgi:hypothetical protein